jgi:monofunctional biosynthetic peptidoglycan transglycosylase
LHYSIKHILAPERRRLYLLLLLAFAAFAALSVFLLGAALALLFWTLPDVVPLKERRATLTIEVRDWQGAEHPFLLGPKNRYWTPLESIPEEMKWAVIVAEDAGFYEHQGIDVPALREALKYNLEQKRMARGASTITQQLAKNVFLSREKSLWRKLREFLLAREMEQELSKGRILELYLNVVELGPMVHGVGHGSRHFFGKTPEEMSPAECSLLAAILPGPRIAYNPRLEPRKVQRRAARLLKLLEGRNILDQSQYASALKELPVLLGLAPPSPPPRTETEDATSGGGEDEFFEEGAPEIGVEPAGESIGPLEEGSIEEEIIEGEGGTNEPSGEAVPRG